MAAAQLLASAWACRPLAQGPQAFVRAMSSGARLTADVALIGAPNAGKSSLMNRMIGSTVAAVSQKANTTRRECIGLWSEGGTQLVFHDVPGFVNPSDRARYERKLITEAESALRQADVLLLVQDIAKRFTQSDRDLIRRVADTAASRKAHFFLALNKADLLTGAHNWRGLSGRAERDRRAKCRELLMAKQDAVADAFEAAAMEAGLLPPDGLARANPPPLHCTSAWHGDGVLRLRSALASVAVPGEWRYPSGIHSDRTNLARVTEAIREALFRNLHQEVPYQAQQVNRGWRVTRKRELVIHQDILVPRRAHVNMLLGRRAATLSAISRAACRALEGIFQRRVHLYLHVAMTKRADGSGVGLEEGVEGVAMAQRGAVDAVGLHRQPLVQDAARQRVQDAVAGLGGLLGEAVPRSPPVADLSAARSAHEAQFLAPDAVWRPPAE